MDFKVAGTAEFVTALQLDTKIDGIPADVLSAALMQARDARMAILEVMNAAISAPRSEVAASAPKIISFEIPADKIGEIIGPKGKVINAIQAETGADISVDDDGMVGVVSIAAVEGERVTEAERQIRLILNPPTAGVGEVYQGKVVNITKFGAFVNILPGRDGLVHISKLGGGKRIDSVESVLSLGDEIEVRVEDIDPNGKISLTPTSAGDSAGGDPKASDGGVVAAPSRSVSRDAEDDDANSDDVNSGDAEDSAPAPATQLERVDFGAHYDEQVTAEQGDLGPTVAGGFGGQGRGGNDRGDRGGDRRRRAPRRR